MISSSSPLMHGPIYIYMCSYRELFLEDWKELASFNTQRLYAPFVWGRILSPDDHAIFFPTIIKSLCGPTSQRSDSSSVVKVSISIGMDGDEEEEGGGSSSIGIVNG